MRSLVLYALVGAAAVAFVSLRRLPTPAVRAEPPRNVPAALAADLPAPPPARYPQVAAPVPVRSESAARAHRGTIERFILEPGFGISRMIELEPVAGTIEVGDERRFVAGHRLIGAWAHEEPRLYESYVRGDHKDAPRRFGWRPLDASDRAALQALGGGADLVATPDRTRLYGALRAERACAKCHDVAPGALLGAFRYDLTPPPELVPTRLATGPPEVR